MLSQESRDMIQAAAKILAVQLLQKPQAPSHPHTHTHTQLQPQSQPQPSESTTAHAPIQRSLTLTGAVRLPPAYKSS